MEHLRYQIETLSPIVFSKGVGDPNMVDTETHIPGSSILGVFAGYYIKQNHLDKNAHEDNKFYKWFLTGDLQFTNAYIMSKEENGNFVNSPVPISIQSEKHGNQIYDLLFKDADFDIETKGVDGYGRLIDSHCQPVKRSIQFHHARDRKTGITKEGELFNYESIDSHQIFQGHILGNNADLDEFLKLFNSVNTVYLGRSKNSQYGKAKFEIISSEPESYTSEIPVDDIEPGDLSLTFLSSVVLYNKSGYSTADINVLEENIKCKILKSFIKTGVAESFVSVWRLRKPSELCFLPGSCFLIEVTEANIEFLKQLQIEGIGERRNEGFGRVVIGLQNDQNDMQLIKKNNSKTNISQPEIQMPEITQGIIKRTIIDLIEREIRKSGLDDAKNVKPLPSKSLIGRLEGMAKTLDKVKFREELIKLRKPAKDKLEACRIGSKNLLEYLKTKDIDVNALLKNLKSLTSELLKIFEEYKISFENSPEFSKRLYRLYLTTLFSRMRKLAKSKEEGGK